MDLKKLQEKLDFTKKGVNNLSDNIEILSRDSSARGWSSLMT